MILLATACVLTLLFIVGVAFGIWALLRWGIPAIDRATTAACPECGKCPMRVRIQRTVLKREKVHKLVWRSHATNFSNGLGATTQHQEPAIVLRTTTETRTRCVDCGHVEVRVQVKDTEEFPA